ncbi:hypothetical protein BT93_L0716 [Corymbia citriodora subsp. variegata]|uniref:Uncharacterized protein n=1 Tax=Corymbia citriodora subsp. variegata TaxID=360336 RepID=A0A8T0CPE2_CORYI|nr:hypothetical protein BT93_L0716 [Corymbia citriodora subsp. variegata]
MAAELEPKTVAAAVAQELDLEPRAPADMAGPEFRAQRHGRSPAHEFEVKVAMVKVEWPSPSPIDLRRRFAPDILSRVPDSASTVQIHSQCHPPSVPSPIRPLTTMPPPSAPSSASAALISKNGGAHDDPAVNHLISSPFDDKKAAAVSPSSPGPPATPPPPPGRRCHPSGFYQQRRRRRSASENSLSSMSDHGRHQSLGREGFDEEKE